MSEQDKCPKCGAALDTERTIGRSYIQRYLCGSSIWPGSEVVGESIDCLRRQLAEAKAENERLRGIVERLPMTADGVSVVPGDDTVWWWRVGRQEKVIEFCVEIRQPYSECEYDYVDIGDVQFCYSTRDAATAALAAKEARK